MAEESEMESENDKLKEEIVILKLKLDKREHDLMKSVEQVTKLKEKLAKVSSYNEELETQMKKLSQEIQHFRSKQAEGVGVSVRVPAITSDLDGKTDPFETCIGRNPNDAASDVPSLQSLAASEVENTTASTQEITSAEPLSIADSLKAAAEAVVQQSGYVFDEKSGMYYDYNTGYYYDNEKALYYDPASGTYFYYDHDSAEYKFHSQVSWHQYTTNNEYTDLDAACVKGSDSSRKSRRRAADYMNLDDEERNGDESRRKHKKRKSRKEDVDLDLKKYKKKKKKKDEKRKREKENGDDKCSRSKKKKRRKEKEREKRRSGKRKEKSEKKEVKKKKTNEKGGGSGVEEDLAENNEMRDRKIGMKASMCEDSEVEIERHKKGGLDVDFKDCDIFDDIVPKVLDKENETGNKFEGEGEDNIGQNTGELTEENSGVLAMDSSENELEEGELSEVSSTSSSSSSDEESDSESESSESDIPMEVEEENSKAYPPCIRAMVISSDKLERGSLFLVTYTGATIGREKGLGHTILIDDLAVSKMHAELKYSEEFKRYVVIDHASQNGTFVNGLRVCEPKVMGEPKALFHGNELTVGGTTLELHIHPGSDTCEGCEPGLVQARLQQEEKMETADTKVLSKEERELHRRKQLKQIKKKFGLENQPYINDMSAINNPNYQDKASERRRTKGSDNPYQKDDAPASVDRAISSENKGRKLLQKMGWTEGESLGKAKMKGLKEPIKVNIRSAPQAGLGSALNLGTSLDNVHSVKKREQWAKMQLRYKNIEGKKDPAPERGGWVSGGVVMDATMEQGDQLGEQPPGGGSDGMDTECKESEDKTGASNTNPSGAKQAEQPLKVSS